ncbi:TRAP transporter small permease [Thauera chlorobenzoica]|uniref:TRAP transporter small permease protein n=1 Tax=Thauera chlorobenzoica TaxID=96773 RepID=A0A1H5VU86_9RHOO|nr:TRAP transporter small permease [Thauera chlorobenzoica]APR03926.1 TRAP dicarboxylate transporter, DctQ subunit [Thauera chlorobenzoica]SEF90693.1 TRAP-type C4-dicarboxylate transport system, small permease component [Thauera chlorobenzoica]
MAESVIESVHRPCGVIGRSIELACTVLALLAGLMFCIEAVMSVVSVVGRAAFNLPVPGDYELVQMLSAMGIAMCLPYCQLKGGHVFVDFFTLWASPWLKRMLDSMAALLMAFCAFVLAWRIWAGMIEMREYGETSMVISLPIWWGYVPVVPSFVLLGITALYTFTQEFCRESKR